MKVLAFSDLHRRLHFVDELVRLSEEADLIVSCGDLSEYGRGLTEMAEALSRIKKPLMLVPGNNETDQQVEELCKRYGWMNLHGKTKDFGEYEFFGVGGSPPTPFDTPFELEEKSFEMILSSISSKRGSSRSILVSHSPPFGTKLDEIASGAHVGSLALRRFIERERPVLNICGHVHERARQEDRLGATKLVNPGPRGLVITI